jgi:hypothetical protein
MFDSNLFFKGEHMSFNISPTGYFPNFIGNAEVGGLTGVFIPYSDLESVDASTSGDIRQLVYSFLEAVSDEYLSLPTGSGSNQLTITRSSTVPFDNVIRKVYSTTVNLEFGNLIVVDE